MDKDRKKTALRFGVVALVVAAVAGAALYAIAESRSGSAPLVYSSRDMIASLWNAYKKDFIEEGTYRVLDPERGGITTSEGQSYAMLRAVWMDDKETFDGVWGWTRENLKRPQDNLFSWVYGTRDDGTVGILENGGENSASDADIDIALSLAFAYSRWQDRSYLESALGIIDDIWNKQVVTIAGKPYLVANSAEKEIRKPDVLINPSYFAPYAFRIFAQIDPERDWLSLVDTSYNILNQSIGMPLDKSSSAGLPPDWVTINRQTGELSAPAAGSGLTTNFSYDALRVPWRIALDHAWFGEPRAKETLELMSFLGREWKETGAIKASYSHDGAVVEHFETIAMNGGSMGYFVVAEPESAAGFYEAKLLPLYSPDSQKFSRRLGYYDANMAWFGMALHNGLLPNLFEANFR